MSEHPTRAARVTEIVAAFREGRALTRQLKRTLRELVSRANHGDDNSARLLFRVQQADLAANGIELSPGVQSKFEAWRKQGIVFWVDKPVDKTES